MQTAGLARRAWAPAVVLCAAMLILLAASSDSRAAEAGVNISSPGTSTVSAIKELNTHWVRMFLSWRQAEPAPGGVPEGVLEGWEQAFRTLPAGTKVILDVVDSPSWATGSADEHAPPTNPQDYANFIAALARRFAPWVKAYEVWNEEDASRWWTGAPDPVAYTALLKAAYTAVKLSDPNATVLVGGLTGNDYDFLEGLYANGAKGYFDAVGVHTDTACNVASPYEFLREGDRRIMPDSFLAYREVHDVMVANGDDKPIWMTEMSWRTTGAECEEGVWAGHKLGGVTEEQQSTFLREAYHCLAQDPYVKLGLWFPLQDEGVVTSGLLRENGSRKPSFAAMKAYVRNGDTLKEACGNFTGPAISIASPSNHVVYSGPLPIHVSAASSHGVFRIRLEIDGKLIRNYDGDSYPDFLSGFLDWQGAKHIPYGRHRLTFLAYDRQMNISQRSITIFHARPRKHRRG